MGPRLPLRVLVLEISNRGNDARKQLKHTVNRRRRIGIAITAISITIPYPYIHTYIHTCWPTGHSSLYSCVHLALPNDGVQSCMYVSCLVSEPHPTTLCTHKVWPNIIKFPTTLCKACAMGSFGDAWMQCDFCNWWGKCTGEELPDHLRLYNIDTRHGGLLLCGYCVDQNRSRE